ncbi:hypothetical protein [Halobacillus massiliensis]|uniref:hypothetical protein n=1 Tax=Halobacillus massiliensis TaxID=1926286 RepID=UPI0015C4720D|nr:hypothetical protein [Halobacillus massiliensis]
MYRIVRQVNNETQALKDSSTEKTKTFLDLDEATLLASKLNSHGTSKYLKWTVEKVG